MNFSPQQNAALVAVDKWLNDPSSKQVFRMEGWAGTGKTTLAKHFAEGVSGTVLFGAFTGKAAYVMRQKGCPGATTIHSMIYVSKEKSRIRLLELEEELTTFLITCQNENKGDPYEVWDTTTLTHPGQVMRDQIHAERVNLSRPNFILNTESEVQHARLIIIDEHSMVDGQMGQDLLSFGVKVLALGDPAQLPPVFGAGFFASMGDPDYMLTEIHRQALDNPIIQMATKVRLHEPLNLGKYGNSQVCTKVDSEYAMEMDQVLVGRNKTRHAINKRVRELLGFPEGRPTVGDKLVCLRNNHDKGLLNGAIYNVEDVGEIGEERVILTIQPELQAQDMSMVVEAHAQPFRGIMDPLPWWERKEAEEFDFGYALTVHKGQGSQWNKVLVYDESYCFKQDKWRWLYTGITRAAEEVTVVRT